MDDIYDRLGVRSLLNAVGNLTSLGGSLMDQQVLDAMTEASRHYVDLHDLQRKVGARIAELLHVQAAFVTTGASGGLLLATAACMTGTDPARIRSLPDTTGMRNEVVILRTHRNLFDQAIRTAGATLVEVGLVYTDRAKAWELEGALNERTAAIFFNVCSEAYRGSLPLQDVVCIAKRHGIPVIVDAAAELPPVANLHRYTDMGADLVLFSGGKDIRGPQSAGLILGRSDLVEACSLNSSPNDAVGRPLKVSKEILVGMLVALEVYLAEDQEARSRLWSTQATYLVSQLAGVPGIEADVISLEGLFEPSTRPGSIPRVRLAFKHDSAGTSACDIAGALRAGDPGIVVKCTGDTIIINPQTLEEGQEKILAHRLLEILEPR
jgi:L-seryl-tRNA(Ser) seleniumtransferase